MSVALLSDHCFQINACSSPVGLVWCLGLHSCVTSVFSSVGLEPELMFLLGRYHAGDNGLTQRVATRMELLF